MVWREKQEVSPSNHFTVACLGQNTVKIAVPYAKIQRRDLWGKDTAKQGVNVSEEGIQSQKEAFMQIDIK